MTRTKLAKNILIVTQFIINIVINQEYCSSFTDINKKFVNGFACPRYVDKKNEIYCCGQYNNKYCCNAVGKYTQEEKFSPIVLWIATGLSILFIIFITLLVCMYCKNCFIAQLLRRNNQNINQCTNGILKETKLGYF
ncbi:unnamed protein product [Gordionus sp. m RMFG-2023]|uniref:protein shisa-like-2B n=1 Tax=Gordionus sp. m RMFG-2023 TaxID=3053472 RepID=UPI0030E41B56